MRTLTACAAAALLAASGWAHAIDLDNYPTAMGYVQVPLDAGSGYRSAPTYGVSMARVEMAPGKVSTDILKAPRIMDFRFRNGQLSSARLNHATVVYRDARTGTLNAFGDVDDPWTWGGVAVAAVGVACVTQWGICE